MIKIFGGGGVSRGLPANSVLDELAGIRLWIARNVGADVLRVRSCRRPDSGWAARVTSSGFSEVKVGR